MSQSYSHFARRQAAVIRKQRMKRLCPQITQINADMEFLFPICDNLPQLRATSVSIHHSQFIIPNSPHDPARNP
jgi:hypothetical protein